MVTSFVELLERRHGGELSAEAKTYITFASEGARRMQRLIRDLLDYSRVGNMTARLELTPLDDIVSIVRHTFAARIEETGAVIETGALPLVRADRAMLTQALQNLVGNALKFRAEAPPRVFIDARLREGKWEVCVRDNGIGIAREHFERVFKVFQRLHGRAVHDGSGIGLSVAKRIVQHHGREIWLESKLGAGSTFFFTLPAQHDDISSL